MSEPTTENTSEVEAVGEVATITPESVPTTEAQPKAEAPAEKQETKPEGSLLQSVTTEEAEKPTDQKAEEQKKAEKPEGAPEAYEKFTTPEGTSLDEGVLTRFSEVAKGLNLPQAKAQEVIDQLAPVLAQSEISRVQAVTAAWREKSSKDQEISNGFADIARLRDRFAKNADGNVDDDIAEFMASPFGNHPGVLKLLARAGKSFGEASFPEGKPTDRKIRASDIYTNSK